MTFRFLIPAVLLTVSLHSSGQYMMMSVESSTNKFKPESTRSGYTDKTEILGYQMEIKSPRDVASGQATGRRQFQPVTLWKTSGASSPQFFQALTKNEQIKKIILQYYRPDEIYKQNELVYTIELENAVISGYRQVMGAPEFPEFRAKSQGLYDEISIVFEKMTVTDNKAKTTSTELWRQSN